MERSIKIPQKLKLPHDSTIPLSGICPVEHKSGYRETLAYPYSVPFTIAKL
jgi:hypothetical protein